VSGAARFWLVVLALSGIGAAAGVLQARESAYPLAPVTERLLYLRSGRTADRLMLSFDALAADVYWIRSIQSYGRDLKNRARPGRFELVEPLLDLTTTLDPHFLIAYRFGAVFLALEPPNGPGRADLAIQLLEKGLNANPTRWTLAHDIGFVHYFHTGNFTAAADWFERSAVMPGAPSGWAGGRDRRRAATHGARQILRAARTRTATRRAAERALEQLDALDRIDAVARSMFSCRRGRYPSAGPR
jgi:hypothetical protein